ncbi:MAG: dihydrofolate reductase [Paludibacteraceae bacterium]|nr:dihydrofolate reductase [Paludibacteraceae bacterium]
MISIIVAIAENYAIGKKGDLLCHLPADLKHFKEITSGKTVLMGERTFFSLPKHPLPNRRNIVLTDVPGKTFEGAEAAYSIDELLKHVSPEEEAFVIGGGMVYRQMMPLADKLYITHIHHSWPDADTFFPEIKADEWKQVSAEKHEADEKNPFDYTFAEYLKR